MDCRLTAAAESAGAVYTRYADDLAFSGGTDFARGITRFQSLSTNPDITLADLVSLGDKDLNSELFRIAGTLSQALSKH